MKPFLMISSIMIFLFSCTEDRQTFEITGHITGICPGDTLVVTRFSLPLYEDLSCDTLLITTPDEFVYEGRCQGSGLYGVYYKPFGRVYQGMPTCITLFIGEKKELRSIKLMGEADYFTLADKSGGYYENEDIKQLGRMEDSTYRLCTDYYRKYLFFCNEVGAPENKNYNKDSVDFYMGLYSGVSKREARKMQDSLARTVNDNEYFAYLYLKQLYNTDYPVMRERYEKFSQEVKNSNTGKVLAGILAVKKNIQPGEKPAPFTVIATGGDTIRLSDYKGKYLLIYHWGLCPGTIWVQPRLLELYEQYKNKGFDILGFTKTDMENTPFARDANLRNSKEIAPLFNHPWKTVFTSEPENKFITDELYFSGVPILMLIAPDGTTLFRGYGEVYEKTKQVLSGNLP